MTHSVRVDMDEITATIIADTAALQAPCDITDFSGRDARNAEINRIAMYVARFFALSAAACAQHGVGLGGAIA